MVGRRIAGRIGEAMPMRGREIASVGGLSLHPPVVDDRCRKPLATLQPARLVKQQVRKNQKGIPSPAELRLIQKYMHETRPLEEGADAVALRKLVKSTTFNKFVQRLELENEVIELHEQLEKEVELHSTLQRALSHSSTRTQLPGSVLHYLPNNVQRLLTDIAMLEATVLRLEMQASALQWDIVHERTERASIEHTLNSPLDASLRPRITAPAPQSSQSLPNRDPASPRLPNPSRTLSPARSTSARSPAQPKSPPLATLKELLHEPAPAPEPFEFCTPPKSSGDFKSLKSPRPNLRSLWSALDGQPLTSLPPILNKLTSKDRARILQSTADATTCFPSTAGIVPPNLVLSSSLSPFTPGEQPRTTTPVTPAACQSDPSPRKSLNPARLLGSTKRLAFWNFSSSVSDDAASLNNRSANPTPEIESRSNVPAQPNCSSILDEDFADDVGMCKLRRSRGMKRNDQSPKLSSSPRDVASFGFCTRGEFAAVMSPRKSFKESPRRTGAETKHGDDDDVQNALVVPADANSVSEEMVRCMVDIYCHLAEPSSESHASQECPLSPSSHTGRLSTSSSLSSSHSDSSARSPDIMNPGHYADVMGCETTPDPYKAMGKLPWANIGAYTDAYEVPWLSVGKNQLEYVAHSLGKFRLLVERLAKVDPSAMTHEQKLAFWINLYNALLMHAFLAYGIPRSDLKFFTLMQKAAYCVGGHWFNAAAIECNLLKAKIMLHRPQFALIMALHNKKLTEEQSRYGIKQAEPKVNFALSCGGHSSPMVRIYTPDHIHEELDSAFQDYLRATVGMTAKGRVLLPKLVYNYAREFVDDDAVVLQWTCRFLPVAQVTVIYECIQQGHRRRLFKSPPFSVTPYSFAFRYLFPKSITTGDDDFKKRYHNFDT